MQLALLLEDFKDTRAWFKEILEEAFQGIEVIEAATIADAKRVMSDYKFDLALVDLNLPDGQGNEVLRALSEQSPETVSVVATVFNDDQHIFSALKDGAQGYLLKDQGKELILKKLKGILENEPPLSPGIARRILGHFQAQEPKQKPETGLTAREEEILTLIGKGLNRPEISRMLNISPHTTAGYVKSIYRKLNISSRAEAAVEAARLGLISTDFS
ncbi:MAG: response regulator transcription factor [Pseudomonadales bacterium]|nr:response regulator transcription factor [Pseudomonadales bacterium]